MSANTGLRDFIRDLEARGKLYRFKEPINKETELLPLYRIQMRGLPDSARKALLFENVVGAKGERYDMSVLAGVYGASEELLTLAMGCASWQEMLEQWHEGYTHPVDPVTVESGPVQEEIHVGKELQELGLDEFPVPVEEPGFSGIIRTGLPMITRDPETGIRNVGTYNGFFRSRDRMTAGSADIHHAMLHWQTARRRGEGLPTAIVIGCDHAVLLVGSAEIPYGVDELAVAGGMRKSPVKLVRCVSIPLEVPADAEAVIEGVTSTEIMEPRPSYGEYAGYMGIDLTVRPVMQVTAITHRKNAMFTPILVGFPPSDSNLLSCFSRSALIYSYLKYERRLPVDEVYLPQSGGGNAMCLIRVSEGVSQESVTAVLNAASEKKLGKYLIAVDSDINLHDPELLVWALSFCTQPKQDFTFLPGGRGGLDPSAAPTRSGYGRVLPAIGERWSRVAINATRKWPYPPVALPRKEYMDRALEIWRGHKDLPSPNLQKPWYGYTLGDWDGELQKYADLIVQGDYIKVGEEMAKLQQRVTEEMFKDAHAKGQ